MKKKKVAIFTWHYYPNFGSNLQAYSLYQQLKKLGYDPVIVDYRNKKYGVISPLREWVEFFLEKLFPRKFIYPFNTFRKEHLKLTYLVQDEEKLFKTIQKVNAVICGSDQIWAPSVLNTVYLLDFVPSPIPKISYAASIGLNDIPKNMVDTYCRLLSRFSSISVRERVGAELLYEKCGVLAKTVLDPTFLTNVSSWIELEVDAGVYEKYIFCYFLKKDNTYRNAVQKFAQKRGLKIIGCSANIDDYLWMEELSKKLGPCEFLWLIHHSEGVFTDSYHGTIFSLLYHKNFLTFERFDTTDPLCQNSRIYQLAGDFGISEHIVRVTDNTILDFPEYDYNLFEKQLSILRKESLLYLNDALECC